MKSAEILSAFPYLIMPYEKERCCKKSGKAHNEGRKGGGKNQRSLFNELSPSYNQEGKLPEGERDQNRWIDGTLEDMITNEKGRPS